MTSDLRRVIAAALTAAADKCDGNCGLAERACYDAITWSGLADGRTCIDGETGAIAAVAVAAIQSAVVPPPPGSDLDKLPDRILARIGIPPYLSTGCQTAKAIEDAIRAGDPDEELADWAERMHASCRLTRKQDMAPCKCEHHRITA